MKHSTVKVVALAVIAGLIFPAVASANPIMVEFSPYGWTTRPDNVFLIALAALGVEWLVIWFFFRKTVRLRRLLAAFVVINLITFPLTWVLSLGVGFSAELLPLIAEPLMYRLYFKRIQVTPRHAALNVVAANLASFIFGLIIFISSI